jgi:hypothetical protein
MNALLQQGKERFHAEKDGLLSTGLALLLAAVQIRH